MQLLAEAPAIGVDAGYGIVAEVKLVQRGKAIERATVHFCQAVIFQVAVEKNQKELTNKQHWSNAERISKKKWDFSHSYTLFYISMWTHACVGISCQRKIEIQGQHKGNAQKEMRLQREVPLQVNWA